MIRALPRPWFALFALLTLAPALLAAEPLKDKAPDLSEFRTVDRAKTTLISRSSPSTAGLPGYLGVFVTPDKAGKLIVDGVEDDSPAARAGLQAGDVVVKVEGKALATADALREFLQARAPGAAVKLDLLRKDKPLAVTATLAAISRPMKPGGQRATVGIRLGDPKEGEGNPVVRVTVDSPAATAGVKEGDFLIKIDGAALSGTAQLNDRLAEKHPGDVVLLTLRRDGKLQDIKVTLAAEQGGGRGGRGGRPDGWDTRASSYWKKDTYRLAVVAIEYPDAKHNDKITRKDWEEALFSRNAYVKKSATGQTVFGSLNDYYIEQSYGNLRVEGKMFNWVEVGKKRTEYGQSTSPRDKTVLLGEALDKLLTRDGKDALKDFDGIFFLYAGDRVQTNRGGLYWPHRASFTHNGNRWSYFITSEGGARMSDISVICHEFGHMLGLPDLYARPENPGSEGLGVWCAMSNQIGNGRPQHFCAWSKEQLGWLKPAVIDPTDRQKLILSPVEDSSRECVKVLVKPDGSEYLLLENRRKKGFDLELPGEGLLIWRVVGNRPILEESHGVEGPTGPRVFLNAVPYPSAANNAFTPYTTPSSRSQLGGGLPVHITNIHRLADGRITFYVGYEYQ